MMPLSFDPYLARSVKPETLEPRQQATSRKLRIAADFRQQVMIKHPLLSHFHSRAEYLYAGLLEGDPRVSSYIPQPFRLRVGRHWYIPNCYVVAEHQPRLVVEIKPRGEFDEALQVPVTHFLAQYGMRFEVISNESVYEREIEAENWLEIVRILHVARDLTTAEAEQVILERFSQYGACTLGDLIDAGDREHTYLQEIALFRLLHQGHLAGELTERPLDYDTGLSLCR